MKRFLFFLGALILILLVFQVNAGEWVDEFETDCGNSIDDDLDTFIDCADPDCDGSIHGFTETDESSPLGNVLITLYQGATALRSVSSDTEGWYNLGNVSCGDYNVVAQHVDYAARTQVLNLPEYLNQTVNFTAANSLVLADSCEEDCTFAGGTSISSSCNGINGCSFFDDQAAQVCNLAKVGWTREYNSTHLLQCPSGSPQEKIETEASVTCGAGTLVKSTSIVIYNGKPVKMVVVSCG